VSTKSRIVGLFLAGTFLASGSVTAESRRGSHAPKSDAAVQLQRISIRVYQGYLIVVEGQFGEGSEPQNFILDTGTSPSIINERAARQLGLRTSSGTVAAVGKAVSAQYTMLPQLKIGPLQVGPLPVAVANLSQVEHDLGFFIGGIVGMDVLENTDFLLDYEKKWLQFGDAPNRGIPVPVDEHSGMATMEVLIDKARVRMLVDTGSEAIVLLGGGFPGQLPLDLKVASQKGGSLAEDKATIQAFAPADIVIAGQHFPQKKAYFVPGRVDPQFDGLLGVRALGFRAISFNRERMTMYLVR
jgi:hypothetical protein